MLTLNSQIHDEIGMKNILSYFSVDDSFDVDIEFSDAKSFIIVIHFKILFHRRKCNFTHIRSRERVRARKFVQLHEVMQYNLTV